ncbi:sensor domain-containing diguanylate cyclase [Tistrella sp. BH-R2-4]|uniref:diguanylate cyclase n=1 Tax=Tistrella arctica TaxID=3133430 RepID=A0ABU9YLL2_9PROT
MFRIDLRRMILFMAIMSVLVMMLGSFYASYLVQRQLLIDNTLDANYAYAAKLAESTQNFIASAQQQLAYSASIIADEFDHEDILLREAEGLRLRTNSFNSVVIIDADGWVRATSPETLSLTGQKVTSANSVQALRERRPIVSQPFMSLAGNLIVFISAPIVDSADIYHGYIGGSIYLKDTSILSSLLGEHYYEDESYLYVVDQSRRLLYHPDPGRVGEVVGANVVIDAIIRGESGRQRVVNSRGVDMLAGFARVPATGWGIVAQRPFDATLEGLNDLTWKVVRNTLPLGFVTLIFIWWFARLISHPLWQLADGAQHMDRDGTADKLRNVRSWYHEALQIKRAMLVGIGLVNTKIGRLNRDVQTDPLTGVLNRRGLDAVLDEWRAEARPFAAIALDIDHFKRVNDTFGHDAGDSVLRNLSLTIQSCAREADIVCRLGGEEFLLLLPSTSAASAAAVAERLRRAAAQDVVDPVGRITISLGVAALPEHGADAGMVLRMADEMLYEAKNGGRNRVVVAG